MKTEKQFIEDSIIITRPERGDITGGESPWGVNAHAEGWRD